MMGQSEPETVSWEKLSHQAAEQLKASPSVDNARWEANLIVQTVCGVETTDWLEVRGQPATTRGVSGIDRMVARRHQGEPLQYVLGEWGFRHLNLLVDRRVLIPRPETEAVVEAALGELQRVGEVVEQLVAVDMGTGSGAIGLSLAVESKASEIWLTDISADSLDVARANLAGIGQPATRVKVAQGSWFEALPDGLRRSVGVIVANPPYVADNDHLPGSVVNWEPSGALFAGPDGTTDLSHLISVAGPWLVPEGSLVVELSPPQVASIVQQAESRFAEVEVGKDLAGLDRWVIARRPKRTGR